MGGSGPKQRSKRRDRLGPDDWAEEALRAMASGGLKALSVEGIAKRLGVTKGSFYWHFKSRDELLEAALKRWERRGAVERFAQLDLLDEPADRLRRLFASMMEDEASLALDFAVQVSADDPRIAPAARRVNRRWVAWLTGVYWEMGLEVEEAHRWALLAYSNYIGFLRIIRTDSELVSKGTGRASWRRFVTDLLIPDGGERQ